jgi:hypothetical protein
VLRMKQSRLRVKRSSDVEGKAIEVTACSGGEAVEGALCRRWPGRWRHQRPKVHEWQNFTKCGAGRACT